MEPYKPGLGERWSKVRPTKTVMFWCCLATAVVTMVLGFGWGGWVTGSTARAMAAAAGEDTLVKRLVPICLAQAKGDPAKADKLKALKALDSWSQTEYVQKQGWATMPGEQDPEVRIASECAKLAGALGP